MTEQERIEAVRFDGEHLKSFKEENRTYRVCLAAVRDNGNALVYVPIQHRSYEMYCAACSNAGSILRIVPSEQIDDNLRTVAVSSDGMALGYVPEELKTERLCRIAVHNTAAAIQFVPRALITPEYCAQIMRDSGNNNLIQWIPTEIKKPAFYEALVREKPDVLFFIPKKARTAKICKLAISGMGYKSVAEAVKDNQKIFDYLNVSLLDHDTCLEYVKTQLSTAGKELVLRTEQPLEKVLISEDICEYVLKYNGRLLEYVPRSIVTENLCRVAVANDYYALNYIPAELLSEELCNIAFQQGVSAICYIPPEYLNREKCLAAVTHYGGFLSYVPKQLRTWEVCNAALQSDMNALTDVPQEYITREMILSALKSEKYFVFTLIHYIPDDLWDDEIFNAVIEQMGIYSSAIPNVPEHKLTYEMCLANVMITPYAVLDVPERFQTTEIYREAARSLSKMGYPRDWKIIERIPERWKTKDFYAVVRENASGECIQHLPSDIRREPIFTISNGVLTRFDANGCFDITIPPTAESVGRCVFWGGEIKSIAASEGVIAFDSLAFSKCNSIKQFYISSTVKALPMSSLRDELQGLREILVDEDNDLFASHDGVLYNKAKTKLLRCPQSFCGSVFVVPEFVKAIGENAFYGCRNLCEIRLPDHELEIGDFAFAYCSKLKKINLPSNAVSIPHGLFLNSAIENVVLPATIKEIGGSAFSYSKLNEIKLPKGIQKIGSYAFQPCSLSEIRIPNSVISPISENTFSSAEIELEIGLVPNGYLLFGTDTKALATFTYARSRKKIPLTDEDYIELISNKTLLKKHFVFVAFLRAFIYGSELSPDIKEWYIGVVKSQKKRLLAYLVSHNYEEYINELLINRLTTNKDIAAIQKISHSTD